MEIIVSAFESTQVCGQLAQSCRYLRNSKGLWGRGVYYSKVGRLAIVAGTGPLNQGAKLVEVKYWFLGWSTECRSRCVGAASHCWLGQEAHGRRSGSGGSGISLNPLGCRELWRASRHGRPWMEVLGRMQVCSAPQPGRYKKAEDEKEPRGWEGWLAGGLGWQVEGGGVEEEA